MSQQRNGEFHRADPGYRRQMQWFLALTVLSGAVAVVALHFWLQRLGMDAARGDIGAYATWLNRLLAGLCLLLAGASAGFSLWLYRMARASQAERRWPPSSMRTSADVRIRYLTSADSLVGQFKATALALAVLALLLAAWSAWLFYTS